VLSGRWECKLCDAAGHGGVSGYVRHYNTAHVEKSTYLDYLREARNERGLSGAEAYKWAHAAWAEYEANQ
jgi:hypothetical protein